jgi:hypothetical protein
MSITFNNLRKDILGEDLARDCDDDIVEIMKKHIEIYELSKKPGSYRIILDLYNEMNALISKRDTLSNTKTGDYLFSPDLSNNYVGRFLCNLDKRSALLQSKHTDVILKFLNDQYNKINIIKNTLGDNFYEACKNRDLSPEEMNEISNIKQVDISDVSVLCSNLKSGNKFIPSSFFKYYRPMYTQKEYIMIDFENLFRKDIELRQEIVENVKRFVNKEFEQWRTLVSEWRDRNIEHNFVYDEISNFKELTNYLSENVNKPEYIDLYRTIRERKPDISSNITILNPMWEFYSAYPFNMTNQEFSEKNYIWLTPEIAQSILYILGGAGKQLSQPIIFKFKFKRPLILLNSQTQNNSDIYEMFLTKDRFTPAHAIKEKASKIFKILGGLNNAENSKILYFIDVINKLINDENYRIDGYRNRRDQNEIAVVDLNSVINTESITKGIFEKVIIKNPGAIPNELVFPFNPPKQFIIPGYKTATWNLNTFRVNCPSDFIKTNEATKESYIAKPKLLYTLEYKWEDDENSKTFNCLGHPLLGNIEDDNPQYVNDV